MRCRWVEARMKEEDAFQEATDGGRLPLALAQLILSLRLAARDDDELLRQRTTTTTTKHWCVYVDSWVWVAKWKMIRRKREIKREQ